MSNTGKVIFGTTLAVVLGGGIAYTGFTATENNKLKTDNKSLTEMVTKITNENAELKQNKQKLLSLIADKDSEINDLTLGLENANKLKTEKENEIKSLVKTIEDKETSISNLDSKIILLEQEKDELSTTITELENDNSTLQSTLDDKIEQYNNVSSALTTAQNEKANLESEKQTLLTEKNNLQTECEDLQVTINTLNSTISNLQSENVRLKNLLNEAGISYKVPGLYVTDTDTLTKSWQQLIDDGDIVISGDELKFSNTSLTGDLRLGDCSNVVHLNATFEFTHLNSVDFTNSNITAVADTSYCFGSSTIKKVIFDFSKMDFSVLDAFFSSCPITEIVGIEKLNTSECVSFTYMFSSVSFSSLDVSFFDFSKAVDITGMFRSNSSLKNVNLGSFDFSSSCTIKDLFYDCPALTDITYAGTIEEWKAKNITNSTTGIKEDGTVTVHCTDGDYVIGGSTETPTEQTDGLEGTYIHNSFTITLDGKGNGTFNNGNEYSFTYTGDGNTKNVSSFGPFDGNANNFVVTSNGIKVHFSDEYGDTVSDSTFTKQTS